MQNDGLHEAQAGIKIAGRNISNLRCTDDATLIEEGKEDHGIRSHYFMANRNSGNSNRLYFGGLQNKLQMVTTAVKLKDACSLEEKL